MLILTSVKQAGRTYLFGVAAFPLIAAYANGKSLSYLVNVGAQSSSKRNESTMKIPIIGKKQINIVEFLAGVAFEVIFIFLLLPFREHVLRIFVEDLEVGEKWPTYVLVACLCSFVIIGGAAAVKLGIRSVAGVRAELVDEKRSTEREKGTINKLTS